MIVKAWLCKNDQRAGLPPDFVKDVTGEQRAAFREATGLGMYYDRVEVSESDAKQPIGVYENPDWEHCRKSWTYNKVCGEQRQTVLENLLNGVYYQGITPGGYGVGVVSYDPAHKVLYWRNFGSSAIEATLEGLNFVIDEVFCECVDFVPCHWSDYHIGYIPDDARYEGFDYSRSHPNVYGT